MNGKKLFFILVIVLIIGLLVWKFGMSASSVTPSSNSPSQAEETPTNSVNPNAANTSVQILPAEPQ